MSNYRRQLLVYLLKLSDMVLLLSALLLSSWYTTSYVKYVSIVDFLSIRMKLVNVIGLLVMLFVWQMVCNNFGLYNSRRLQGLGQEWKDIIKATSLGTGLFLLGAHVFNIVLFTPVFTSVFWLSTTVLTISFRTILRQFLKKVRVHGRNLRFVLIIGTNERAYNYLEMIKRNRASGYRVIGFVDDRLHIAKPGIGLLGHLADFSHIISELVIDEVVIALPVKSYYEKMQEIIEKAEEQGVTIRYLSHLFNTKISVVNTTTLGGVPVLEMTSKPREDSRFLAKRALDVVGGTLLLVLTLPVTILAAIAIKLTSPGPVLFVQQRVGYNKRIFQLYKFRTMVVNAERMQRELEVSNEMDGPVFKIEDDPRITKIGRWLRKMSIDELPQLYNVIRGEMSLVGPRPLPVRDYNGFEKDWQRRRFSVRPGLTCLWQINGRNHTKFEDWMKLDMQYIDNWTLLGDIKILFQTIPVLINGKGAS
ncbi:MAG: sugar transferase [Proteobacteria bacterium]|nr:sugar transferase [Pseudomonadota bacterium]